MCGINLINKPGLHKDEIKDAISSMVASCDHRGPDESSYLIQNNLAFGFNRLEIVGGKLGKQPIIDHESGITLICNGEIFNHQALRNQYCSTESFATQSDTEIILHLYKKFGQDCFAYLEGQFSFVIFDPKGQKVILARDRFGINPLFYSLADDALVASSEIKSIFASDLIKHFALDKQGIAESLLFYGPVPPRTNFEGISQIPPASYGTYDLTNKTLDVKSYWNISSGPTAASNLSAEALEHLLVESVQKRLQGASTPGVYVSGGLDSSIIASIASRLTNGKIELFAIAFDDKRYDESKYQIQLARALNANLNQITVSLDDLIINLEKCVLHVEGPLIRTAPIPMLMLSRKTREEGIKFALCGEGADEMFAGYPVFQRRQASYENKWGVTSRYLKLFKDKSVLAHAEKMYETIARLGNKNNWLAQKREQEIATKLSQYLLVNQGDRMSMANGVEQRFPFLDRQVARFAFSLDESHLLEKDGGKVLLREAFRKYLPQELIERKKQGYLAPDDKVVTHMLSASHYAYLLEESYFDEVGVFDFEEAQKLIDKVRSGQDTEKFDSNAILFMVTTHLLYCMLLGSHSAVPARY